MKSEGKEMTANQQRLWRLTAAMAPLILLGADTGWVSVLVCWGITALLQISLENTRETENCRWMKALRIAVHVLALGMSMEWVGEFWGHQEQSRWIPVILTVLGALAAGKGYKESAFGTLALLWVVGILLGSVLFSALPEVTLKNLLNIRSETGKEVPVLTVMLLTAGGLERKKTEGRRSLPWAETGSLCLLAAICTQGVFSGQTLVSPFYELSRSVRLMGKLKRYESFAILGVLLGGWLWFSFLLSTSIDVREKRRGAVWAEALMSCAMYLLKIRVELLLLCAVILSEYILPMTIKNKTKKSKESG